MYFDRVELRNVRTFDGKGTVLSFVHPDCEFRSATKLADKGDHRLPQPRLPNVNLLLGDNGSGKTTVLRAIAASAFGPAAKDLLRDSSIVRHGCAQGSIVSALRFHQQDHEQLPDRSIVLVIDRQGERLNVSDHWHAEASAVAESRAQYLQQWSPIFESTNDAFFIVGYGATRRVERMDSYDAGARAKSRALRDQRVASLFEDSFSLIPLASWLPALKTRNPGRYKQVVNLLNELLKPGLYRFIGDQSDCGDYHFRHASSDMPIPFQSLSDGYRAFVGWASDLLHHVCFGCPKGKKLVESCGVVLVDEIDLHLHPKWQMKVLESISKALPKMQFIVTSHSPLVASSLEWMNVITLKTSKSNVTKARRVQQSIHGLDADQILLTDLFGLKTTRAPPPSSSGSPL